MAAGRPSCRPLLSWCACLQPWATAMPAPAHAIVVLGQLGKAAPRAGGRSGLVRRRRRWVGTNSTSQAAIWRAWRSSARPHASPKASGLDRPSDGSSMRVAALRFRRAVLTAESMRRDSMRGAAWMVRPTSGARAPCPARARVIPVAKQAAAVTWRCPGIRPDSARLQPWHRHRCARRLGRCCRASQSSPCQT